MIDVSKTRSEMLATLPIRRDSLLVRSCQRSDLDILATWPEYPQPYASFTFSFSHFGPAALDSLHRERERQQDRITLVVDRGTAKSIAYLSLLEIDWASGRTGNMGMRVHPELCGKGIGSTMLTAVRDWWFAAGMQGLRLDVAAPNARAVRCYEKVGFTRSGEFWREAPDLDGVDLSDPQWRFLEGHVRAGSGVPELRFYWMETSPG